MRFTDAMMIALDKKVEEHILSEDIRFDEMAVAISENSRLVTASHNETKELVAAWTDAKGFIRVVKWASSLFVMAVAAWAAISQIPPK